MKKNKNTIVLQYTTGYLATSPPTINGKELQNISLEEQKDVLLKMIDKCPSDVMQEIFIHLLETYGKCEYMEPCETCGDIIEEYTFEL